MTATTIPRPNGDWYELVDYNDDWMTIRTTTDTGEQIVTRIMIKPLPPRAS